MVASNSAHWKTITNNIFPRNCDNTPCRQHFQPEQMLFLAVSENIFTLNSVHRSTPHHRAKIMSPLNNIPAGKTIFAKFAAVAAAHPSAAALYCKSNDFLTFSMCGEEGRKPPTVWRTLAHGRRKTRFPPQNRGLLPVLSEYCHSASAAAAATQLQNCTCNNCNTCTVVK
jgi:hypothetical protein